MSLDHVQLFLLNSVLIDKSLQTLQRKLGSDIGYLPDEDNAKQQSLYEDFPQELRDRANRMSHYYEVFYCLENSIRNLVEGRLEEKDPENWWTEFVPPAIQQIAEENKEKEAKEGFTPRSDRNIDYLNFGDLSVIISKNWPEFGDTLTNKNAVARILATLNRLRGPIAHCNQLADDEVDRLGLALKDWMRQLGA
ncbi:Swt1 family HEPN domain-containing protein [Pyruvatibacter mobilis]|uniref:Swt1 family HEPN domain-containing protein n=1 Tax=Pyruvatibacter mobilis TaxID=1712261 RepID=UPI003C7AE20A